MQSENLQTVFSVELDKVPKKYAGLDGTEIAISESQERMAVVVDPKDVDEFMGYAKEENLEATLRSSSNRRAKTCTCNGEAKRLSIFPVHSLIQTVLIRRQIVEC